MRTKVVITGIVVVVAALINIFTITVISLGANSLPFYFMATFLNWVAGILIGFDMEF